jgi:GNAT superfamily N-acetyltransferase
VDDLPRLQRMLDAADLLVTAWDGKQLVGVARSLTDFSFACYLSDLAVASPYQRRGIGRALVEHTRKQLGEEVMLLLIAAPDAMEYYPRIGFEPMTRAWYIPRQR